MFLTSYLVLYIKMLSTTKIYNLVHRTPAQKHNINPINVWFCSDNCQTKLCIYSIFKNIKINDCYNLQLKQAEYIKPES